MWPPLITPNRRENDMGHSMPVTQTSPSPYAPWQ